jgi:O-antigen/teichoic acid export membrane protein
MPFYLKKFSFTTVDAKHYKNLFSYSVLLTITNIFFTALNNGDRFIIDHYKSKEKLGQYSLNYSLATVGFSSFIQLFTTIFLPAYIKNIGSKGNNQSNIRIIQIYVLIFSPLLCFFIFNSSIFTEIFLGEGFRGFSPIFNWVAAGIYCYGFANFFETRLKILNRIKTVAIILGVHTIVNLVLNMLLLKYLEMNIAAIVTFASYLSVTIFFVAKNWMFFLSLNLLMIFQRIVLASALFLLTCIFVKNSSLDNFMTLLINCILGMLLYYVFLRKHFYLLKNSIREVGNYSPIGVNQA